MSFAGSMAKMKCCKKSNLIFIIWTFYNCHHTTYLSFWLLWHQSFKRNFVWTFDITNYLSKKNWHIEVFLIFHFRNITNSRNRLSGFLFSSDIEMALFSDRKNYCISHFMEGQILFSQVGFFFTSVKDCHQGNYKNVK